MEPKRNFVMLFRGREGSSPIITQLGTHPEINVPIFEHLDKKNARKRCPDARAHLLLDGLLGSGDLAAADAFAQENADLPPRSDDRAIGFKWRAWGSPERIATTLQQHQAIIFHLFRRDFLESTASIYFSRFVVPEIPELKAIRLSDGLHTQFNFRRLRPERQHEVQEIMRAWRFTLPADFTLSRMTKNLAEKKKMARTYVDPVAAAGLTVRHVFYEDYLADPPGLIAAMCRTIGCDPELSADTRPRYAKVNKGNLLEQVENLDELRQHPGIAERLADFETLCQGYPDVMSAAV